jgi:hypothetical protein
MELFLNWRKVVKLNQPIEIDFLEFFKTGKFDYLKLGQTKEAIIHNFPDPDCYDLDFLTEEVKIWTYGGIELHFSNSELYLIFSDHWYEGKLESDQLKLNKWIFENIDQLNLLFVIKALNEHNIDFKTKTDQLGVLLRLNSGIEFTFENIDDVDHLSTNDFHITSFSLVAENPYRWKK